MSGSADATFIGQVEAPDPDATRLGVPGVSASDADVTLAGTSRGGLRPPTRGTWPLTGSRTGATGSAEGTAAPGRLEVGEAFGPRYRIIRMLGVGGMGAVYHAWDYELEVALALKVIRPDATADPVTAAEVERRFKQELLLARQVTHPNVVRIHDLGEIDGIKYITMPYVEGTDLAGILADTPTLPVPRALHIARQVAAGLNAAHAAGVVHRDLKPANIMIDGEGNALIMDFGIARANVPGGDTGKGAGATIAAGPDGGTRLGTVVGTIEYMAPEQARGQAADQRADIYTFGLILYRLLVGKPPSAGGTDQVSEMMARIQTEPPRLRTIDPTIPEAVEEIVSRCVEPDRDKRFQTTADLVAALDSLDENGSPRPQPKHLTKSPRFWAVAASVTIALVSSTWWFTQRFAPSAPAAARDPVTVLVADFANGTGDPAFDGLVEQSLGVGIEGASFITAYQRPAALRVARQIKVGDRLTEQAARLVAMREGIKVVLTGSIETRGSGYVVSARGIEPSSGNVLLAATANAAGRDAVLRATGTLSATVRKALGDTRAADAKESLSAASLDAVSDYTKAQELSVAGRDEQAIPYYKRATERDPNFGRAWGGWASSATRLGRKEDADPLWKQALSHLDGMTERERYRLLGAYYTLVTRNYDKALETYATLVNQYPADGAGHNNLAVGYFRKLDFKKALEEGQRVLRVYPNSPLYRTNYALYAMYAGDFDTAASVAKELIDDKQSSYDTYLPLAISAIADGKLDMARDAYDKMSKTDPAGASLATTGLADLALHEGRATDAVKILQEGIKVDQAEQNPAGVVVKEIALADALGMQGDLKGAVAAVRRALAIDRTESQILPAVRWLIASKNLDEAARLGEELDQRLETQVRAYGRIVAAQVAMARGKRVEAVDAMREALKFADLWLVRFNLGQAYLGAGAPAEAFSEFQACVTRRGEGYAAFLDDVPTVRYVAPIRYWIGRAREGMGLLPQAQGEYRTFISGLAKDSPDPLLQDARARAGGR